MLLIINSSCKKFIVADPPIDQLTSSSVFTSDSTAKAALTAIYRRMMMQGSSFANGDVSSLSFLAGLSSDELVTYSTTPDIREFYQNAINVANTSNYSYIWGEAYGYIYLANAAISGLQASSGVSTGLKNQLLGEAYFIRAFSHFYLTNLYGDVPLIISTDYTANAKSGRAASRIVYQQIVKDLVAAENLMSADYSYSQGERVRPNKWAAAALLARVYLYTGDWVNAETQATAVLSNPLFVLNPDLNTVFLKNSTEAIWQLLPVVPGYNSFEGNNFILTDIPSSSSRNSSTLSDSLLSSFEAGDQRRYQWVDSFTSGVNNYYFPDKYKIKSGTVLNEYSMVLRLAEQYLIRAEARTALNSNLAGAAGDLNVIRQRAGLPNSSASTQQELFNAIQHERQVELFSEWGHRWFDLKRWNLADSILNTAKPQYWQPFAKLYPIPQTERQNDPQLTQNSGY